MKERIYPRPRKWFKIWCYFLAITQFAMIIINMIGKYEIHIWQGLLPLYVLIISMLIETFVTVFKKDT